LTEQIKLTDISEILARPKIKRWPKPPRAPSLQDLVEFFERYGKGYDRISPENWAAHDAAMAKWRLDRADYYIKLHYRK
jgi:hypothetical protein